MDEHQILHFDVPEGFPPMSLPTKPETRLPKDKIAITYCEEADLEDWCALCYEVFPNVFWDFIEKTEGRPPLSERTKILAKHFKLWLHQPGYHMIKAVHTDTNETLGFAGWHENGVHAIFPTEYESLPGLRFPNTFVPCSWRIDLATVLGQDTREGYTQQDLASIKAHHSSGYQKHFLDYDRGRLAEMGDQPHWYLAPFCVWPKWNGRGVGRELLMWALDKADEKGWPAVLESLPNARPVYYHMGFEPTASHGSFRDDQLVRPAQKK